MVGRYIIDVVNGSASCSCSLARMYGLRSGSSHACAYNPGNGSVSQSLDNTHHLREKQHLHLARHCRDKPSRPSQYSQKPDNNTKGYGVLNYRHIRRLNGTTNGTKQNKNTDRDVTRKSRHNLDEKSARQS